MKEIAVLAYLGTCFYTWIHRYYQIMLQFFEPGNISSAPRSSWMWFYYCSLWASLDTEERKLSCRKNGRKNILSLWHHSFGSTPKKVVYIYHFLTLFSGPPPPPILSDVLFEKPLLYNLSKAKVKKKYFVIKVSSNPQIER